MLARLASCVTFEFAFAQVHSNIYGEINDMRFGNRLGRYSTALWARLMLQRCLDADKIGQKVSAIKCKSARQVRGSRLSSVSRLAMIHSAIDTARQCNRLCVSVLMPSDDRIKDASLLHSAVRKVRVRFILFCHTTSCGKGKGVLLGSVNEFEDR